MEETRKNYFLQSHQIIYKACIKCPPLDISNTKETAWLFFGGVFSLTLPSLGWKMVKSQDHCIDSWDHWWVSSANWLGQTNSLDNKINQIKPETMVLVSIPRWNFEMEFFRKSVQIMSIQLNGFSQIEYYCINGTQIKKWNITSSQKHPCPYHLKDHLRASKSNNYPDF